MHQLKLYWYVFFVSLTLICKAQQYNFIKYSLESGLPQSSIFDIYQDKRGYIWVGTEGGGISQFDGVKFKTFNKKNGLSGNTVRSIIEDKNGLMWFGTDEGICTYDGKLFHTIAFKNNDFKKNVLKLFCDNNNNIWASFPDIGLLKFKNINDSTPHLYSKEEGLGSNFIFDFQQLNQNEILLATYMGGINILNTKTEKIKIISTEQGLPSPIILCIEKDNEGNYWFGTKGSNPFSISEKELNTPAILNYKVKEIGNYPDEITWDIKLGTNNELFFASDKNGLISVNGDAVKVYNNSNGLSNNQIFKLFKDKSNILWIGTLGSGLNKFLGTKFYNIKTKIGTATNQINNITQDKDNNYWLASSDGLVKLTNDPEKNFIKTIYTTNNGLPDNYLTSLCFDKKGRLWIGTKDKGVACFDGKNFKSYTVDNGLSGNNINSIYADKQNRIWFATSAGVTKFENEKFATLNENNGLIYNEVQSIIEDKIGNIWMATLGGLAMYNNNSLENYNEKDGLADKKLNCLTLNPTGELIIGTFGGGVYRLAYSKQNKVVFSKLISDSLLSSGNIYGLNFIDKETLLVATDKGFDKAAIVNGKPTTITTYNNTDGFLAIENNLNALYKDHQDVVWFGTVDGITIFNPKLDHLNSAPPEIHLTDIKLFFQTINWTQKHINDLNWFSIPETFTLKYNENHLTFNYAALNFSNPNKVKYKYRLVGADNDWSPATTNTEAIYSSISPGPYTFQVQACNENGIWTKEPASISFIISQPFYKTIWFISICLFSVILLAYSYIKWREKELKKKNLVLEKAVTERTQEVVEQKKVIETKNKDITDSIQYAKRIQKAILPPETKIQQYIKDCFVFYKPKDIVSGDFYFFSVHDSEGQIIENESEKPRYMVIAAADCTGHGVPGALMSMIGYNGLNYAVTKTLDSGQILDELSNFVEQSLALNSSQSIKDGMDISLCVIDFQKQTISYSGANNPLYIIREGKDILKINKTVEFKPVLSNDQYSLYELKATKQPIGAFEDKKGFLVNTFNLTKGDALYLFTDGYADQFGGPNGKKYKYSTFKNLLLNNRFENLTNQKGIVSTSFKLWKGELEQVDDICVIGIIPVNY